MRNNNTTSARTYATSAELRAARQRVGMSRARLAGLVGCSPTSLANFEAGAIPKRSAVLERALAVLAEHEG
jgi:transcriptional regulator with XRE-family HTH domain